MENIECFEHILETAMQGFADQERKDGEMNEDNRTANDYCIHLLETIHSGNPHMLIFNCPRNND